VKAAKVAGLTPGEWAREHGTDGRSLNVWRVNLARGEAERRSAILKTGLVLPSNVIDGARRRLRDGHLGAALGSGRSATAITA